MMPRERCEELISYAIRIAMDNIHAKEDIIQFCMRMVMRMLVFVRIVLGTEVMLQMLDAIKEDSKQPLPDDLYPPGWPKDKQ